MADALPVGLAAVGPSGVQVYANHAFSRLVGWEVSELVGLEPPFPYWHPDDHAFIRRALDLTLAGQAPAEGFRLRFRRKDGSALHVLASIAPFLSRGATSGWVSACTDLTAQTAAESAVRERDERLELALRAGGLGWWEYEISADRVTWSSSLERIHGIPEGSFGGSFQDYTRDIHPEDVDRVLGTIERSSRGHAEHHLEYRIIRPDGEVRWLEARGRLLEAGSDRPARMLGVCADVTTRHEAEASIRKAKQEAERANRAKSDFLAAMSHELRTPLNAISGYVDLLDAGVHGDLSDAQREALGRVRHNQKHLLALINDVLQFARIEAGRLDFRVGRLEMSPFLADIGSLVERQAAAAEVSYVVLPCAPDVAARGDSDRVRQIVLNLLSNAIKFTGRGGRVTLSCERAADRVEIDVADTGRGISSDRLEAIFDPFVQGAGHSDDTSGGVGLGLAISRDLARAMGGEIRLRSELGRGSTFTLDLPSDDPAG